MTRLTFKQSMMNRETFFGFVLAMTFICGTNAYDIPYLECHLDSVVNSLPGLDDSFKDGQILFYTNQSASLKEQGCSSFNILNITSRNDSQEGSVVTINQDLGSYCAKRQIVCTLPCDNTAKKIEINAEIIRNQPYDILFKNPNYTATVEENVDIGTNAHLNAGLSVRVANCSSGTETINGYDGRYTLSKSTVGPFKWYTETSDNSLHVEGQIDYEKQQSYHLIVEAVMRTNDNKHLIGSATADLLVNVIDIDDNNPKFNISMPDVYQLNVTEKNASFVNIPLATTPPIHAYDPDFGINQTIFYSILAQEEPGLFAIGNDSLITISKELDYEKKSKYTISIKAAQTDKPDTATAVATVQVDVVDIDDNLPMFTQKNYTCSINEHSSVGSIICKIMAIDNDTTPENSDFSYYVWSDNVPVSVNKNGEVIVKNSAALDREKMNGTLILKVGTKTANDTFADNTTVAITLVDINDNSPIFVEDHYYFYVNDSKTGDIVGVVHADDKDEDLNSKVAYSLLPVTVTCSSSPVNSKIFSINATSGEIKFAMVDQCERYVLTAQACDSGVNRRCNFTTVEVVVDVANGTVKAVTQSVSIVEESPNNTYIALLECHGDNHLYTYYGGPEFVIETNTGMLKTNAILDRERNDIYNFLVNVSRGNMLLCEVNVTVKVTDINDNAPVFIGAPYKFALTSSPKDGDLVGTIKATDSDILENGNVSYYLGRQSNQAFRIDQLSGNITVNQADHLTEDIVELYAIAIDNGTPPRQNHTIVYATGDTKQSTVPISTPLTVEHINRIQQQLERSVSNIMNITVEIDNVEEVMNKSSPYKSRIHIRTAKSATVSKEVFLSQVLAHYEDIRSLFYQSSANTGTDQKKSGFGASEIGLIVMAAVILIGAILAIFIVHRQFSSQKRYKQLYDSLTKNSSIYESQEITINITDDGPECNGTVHNQDINQNNVTTDLAVTALNPAYTPDSDATVIADANEDVSEDPENENTNVKTSLEESQDSNDKEENDSLNEEGTNVPPPIFDADLSSKNHGYENMNVVNANMEPVTESDGGEESPIGKSNDLITFDSESNEGAKEQMEEESELKPTNDDMDDEPKPDYNEKQVRFHSEVLDAGENKLEPLKIKNEDSVDDEISEDKEIDNTDSTSGDVENVAKDEDNMSDTGSNAGIQDVNMDSLDSVENVESLHNSTDDTDRLEEEMVAPGMTYDEHVQNQFFFGDMESTHF